MAYRYKPSRAKRAAFAEEMRAIEDFCREHGIDMSGGGDSYYFTVNGQAYRVSNHSVESSNAHAYNWAGEKTRDLYHPGGRREDTIYIHASKTRIREIYSDLVSGYRLDGRGNRAAE